VKRFLLMFSLAGLATWVLLEPSKKEKELGSIDPLVEEVDSAQTAPTTEDKAVFPQDVQTFASEKSEIEGPQPERVEESIVKPRSVESVHDKLWNTPDTGFGPGDDGYADDVIDRQAPWPPGKKLSGVYIGSYSRLPHSPSDDRKIFRLKLSFQDSTAMVGWIEAYDPARESSSLRTALNNELESDDGTLRFPYEGFWQAALNLKNGCPAVIWIKDAYGGHSPNEVNWFSGAVFCDQNDELGRHLGYAAFRLAEPSESTR
jgi:hypothetical protein